ncbi:MAG: VOC family protein [Geminicoccaceae bacterium]
MSWSIHHVNLPATDVRASAEFYTRILGMAEGAWAFPPPEQVGYISADPKRLTLFPCGTASRGRTAACT